MFLCACMALLLTMRLNDNYRDAIRDHIRKTIRNPITDYLFENVLPKPPEKSCYRCRHFEASRILVENITFEMGKCRRRWIDSTNRTLPLYVSFLRNNESFCGNGGKYYTPQLSTPNTTVSTPNTTDINTPTI